jgi:hypothetical protein
MMVKEKLHVQKKIMNIDPEKRNCKKIIMNFCFKLFNFTFKIIILFFNIKTSNDYI